MATSPVDLKMSVRLVKPKSLSTLLTVLKEAKEKVGGWPEHSLSEQYKKDLAQLDELTVRRQLEFLPSGSLK